LITGIPLSNTNKKVEGLKLERRREEGGKGGDGRAGDLKNVMEWKELEGEGNV